MFERSRAHLFVRTEDGAAVVSKIGRELRRWRFRRYPELPADHKSVGATEIRELYWCVRGPWTCLAPEDHENTLQTAYALSKAEPSWAVLASVAYKYGDWHLKAYHQKDCVMKLGDGPDHELSWPAPRTTAEDIDSLSRLLGGDGTFGEFLTAVLQGGRPEPRDLEDGLDLPTLSVGFEELKAGGHHGWTHEAWAHESSPIWRRSR